MLIYIILYTLLVFTLLWENKENELRFKKIVIYASVLVFTLFRGLRWETGTDWPQYFEVFNDATWNSIFSYDRGFGNMEIGYMFINMFIKSIYNDYTFFLLVTNLFILNAFAKFSLTNSTTPIMVFVLIMFSTQFFPVRIGLAVGVIIWGLFSFSDKKYWRVIICSLIAVSIHSSSIVFLLAYFICFYKKLSTYVAVGSAIGTIVLVQLDSVSYLFSELSFIYSLFGEHNATKFDHYLDYTENAVSSSIFSSLNSLIFIFTLWLFGNFIKNSNTEKDNTNYNFVYNMYFIFVMIGIAFSAENMANLKRMQNYFMFAFPVLFSKYITYSQIKYSKIKIVFSLILILYLLFRAYSLFNGAYSEELFPYYSIFDNNINLNNRVR